MFSDPLITTKLTVASSLPRISISGQSSIYRVADGSQIIKVSHQNTKNRVRRLVRFETACPGINPITSEATNATVAIYLVIDVPSAAVFADPDGNILDLCRDFQGFLFPTDASQANLMKVLGSEI